MTTIAWDGTTLAADQCVWVGGGIRRKGHKLFKIEAPGRGRLLVAVTGDISYCMKVLEWAKGTGAAPDPNRYFDLQRINAECAVAIDETRGVWIITNDTNWLRMDETQFAAGAGQEFAWGALEAGATAEQAVRIAIKRSDYAGFDVDTLTF